VDVIGVIRTLSPLDGNPHVDRKEFMIRVVVLFHTAAAAVLQVVFHNIRYKCFLQFFRTFASSNRLVRVAVSSIFLVLKEKIVVRQVLLGCCCGIVWLSHGGCGRRAC